MKITRIGASNYQRLVNVDIPVSAPLLLLAGENEQGKTSLADAIYHAVTGIARRVDLKKDFGDLVHDGQKRGVVAVEVAADQDEPAAFTVTVPSDKRTVEGVDEHPLMPYLLDASKFPRLKPDERRALLFTITGKRISGKVILEKLKEKGADPKKAADIGSVLLAGFGAAQQAAKTNASEARGAWKAITGEVYGSKKAEDWKAPKPEYDAERIPKLESAIKEAASKITAIDTRLGELQQQRKAYNTEQDRRKALCDLIDMLPRREAKLKADEELVTEWQAKVDATAAKAGEGPKVEPMTCPHCAGLVELQGKALVEHNPGKAGDPQAIALLPTQREALSKVVHARDNAKRDVTASLNAKAALEELDKAPAPEVKQADIDSLNAERNTHESSRKALNGTLDEILAAKKKAEDADNLTKTAARHHKDVCEWAQMEEWLAPSGIQAELLAEAMKPFNDRLAATAATTGWDKVEIDPEMTIRIGGRAYSLCSASARWRAQAAIVEAMAHLSGAKTFLLDEVEILVGANRVAFLTWMHKLALAGEVDTAILIGSFKDKPGCPATFQVEWVKDGMAGVQQQQEAA